MLFCALSLGEKLLLVWFLFLFAFFCGLFLSILNCEVEQEIQVIIFSFWGAMPYRAVSLA